MENVANVKMLPVPMLPVPIGIGFWEWQHWILATFDQVIGKDRRVTGRDGARPSRLGGVPYLAGHWRALKSIRTMRPEPEAFGLQGKYQGLTSW